MKHLTAGVFVLLCASASSAEAQAVASSFTQLAVLVEPGDKVTVVDAAGREARGRISTLSADALILITEAGPWRLGEADVATISQRRGDSLTNGAIIGAVAGATYFATVAALLHDSDGGDIIVPTAIAGGVFFAGLGAAAGVGIDALISRRQVIFRKTSGATRVSVSPVLGRRLRGAAVTVKF